MRRWGKKKKTFFLFRSKDEAGKSSHNSLAHYLDSNEDSLAQCVRFDDGKDHGLVPESIGILIESNKKRRETIFVTLHIRSVLEVF